MAVLIALLRGINVGGHNKLPMKDFRAIVESLGARDVATYIQSGNAVFATRISPASFEKALGAAIEDRFGFRPDVFVLRLDDLNRVIAGNPYAAACADPSKLFITFLKKKADQAALKEVEALLAPTERIAAKGTAVYFDAPDGVGRSKAAEKFARIFPGGTMRNWRTCLKLQEMAAG